jgi:hypothetical protein
MSYSVRNSSNNLVTTVQDGSLNNDTSLQLVGIGYTAYSEIIAESFVKLMENFANSDSPLHPQTGQLWFDTTHRQLKVYDANFRTLNNVVNSTVAPTTNKTGDFWYDSNTQQLKYYDENTASYRIISPIYSSAQQKSGFEVDTLADINNNSYVVTKIYNHNVLVSIIANDTFYPEPGIAGFISLKPGINNAIGYNFDGSATNSEQLGNVVAANYARLDVNNNFYGVQNFKNTVNLGNNNTLSVATTSTYTTLTNNTAGSNINVNVTNSIGNNILAQKIFSNGYVKFISTVESVNLNSQNITGTGTLSISGAAALQSTLSVTGAASFSSITLSDSATIAANVNVANVAVSDTLSANNIDATQVSIATTDSSEVLTVNGNEKLNGTSTIYFKGTTGNSAIQGRTDGNGLAVVVNNTDRLVYTNGAWSIPSSTNLYANTAVYTPALVSGNVSIFGGSDSIVGTNNLNLITSGGYTGVTNLLTTGYVTTATLGVSSTSDSTSYSSGPSLFYGGVGITKRLNVGNSITVVNGITAGGNINSSSGIAGSALAANTSSGAPGTIRAADNIFSFTASDKTLKENIVKIPDALAKVCQINGVEFDWSDEYLTYHGGEDGHFIRKHDVGVIAQEIQNILPEAVVERTNGKLAVDYEKIVPLLIEAIKTLNEKVAILQDKLNDN